MRLKARSSEAALREHASAMGPRDGPYDEQAEARPFDVRERAIARAIKPLEDALQLVRGDSYAPIAHAQGHAFLIRRNFELDGNIDLAAGIFDGVVENVGDGGAKVVRIALHLDSHTIGARGVLPMQRGVLEVMPRAREFHAFADQPAEINLRRRVRRFFVSHLTRLQDLLHGIEQAIGILEHEAVKLLALRFVHLAPLQRFEVEANRRDGRFQLVRHGVDETVVLLVAPDFTHQKDGVEH
jgi:hypothetical protein